MSELYIIVKGNVTGVGFRAWVVTEAKDLGLTGWVRNKGDGLVEAIFQGNSKALGKIAALMKEGPCGSKVESMEYFWRSPSNSYDGFRIY